MYVKLSVFYSPNELPAEAFQYVVIKTSGINLTNMLTCYEVIESINDILSGKMRESSLVQDSGDIDSLSLRSSKANKGLIKEVIFTILLNTEFIGRD